MCAVHSILLFKSKTVLRRNFLLRERIETMNIKFRYVQPLCAYIGVFVRWLRRMNIENVGMKTSYEVPLVNVDEDEQRETATRLQTKSESEYQPLARIKFYVNEIDLYSLNRIILLH